MKRTDKKGITLIELIIAAGICAIVIAAAYTVLTTGYKTYNKEFSNTVDQQGLRSAMISIDKKVRNPSNTITIASPNVLKVNGNSYTVSSGSLMYNGSVVARNISAINANYVAGSSNAVVQIDLTSAGGNTLSTQIQVG